jgi:hypothetical protein
MVDQKERKTKQDYKFFHEISTRWNDNDVRWHMNNAKYYEFFDTVIGKMPSNIIVIPPSRYFMKKFIVLFCFSFFLINHYSKFYIK